MINDFTNGKLADIKAYATNNDLTESFTRAYGRFEHYSQKGCEVNLYSDFAPLSLYFEVLEDGRLLFNGGLIFHGPHDGFGNGSAPTFSVCLEPERTAGWSIHT